MSRCVTRRCSGPGWRVGCFSFERCPGAVRPLNVSPLCGLRDLQIRDSDNGQRPTEQQKAGHVHRATGDERRMLADGSENVRAVRPTTGATRNARLGLPRASVSATSVRSVTLGVHNKPMVPTAPTSPVRNPSRPLRWHIGQSLGSFEPDLDSVGGGQAAASCPGV